MTHRALLLAAAFLNATACAATPAPPEAPRVTPADLTVLIGGGWTGTLTYRDYSPPFGEVTIQAALDVREGPEGLTFAYIYPKEPQANSEGQFPLAADGTLLDEATVTAVARTPDAVEVTTTAPCEDAGKPATCTYDYSVAAKAFTVRKTVQAGSLAAPFTRNTYRFTRP
jgi:hypothetical protein